MIPNNKMGYSGRMMFVMEIFFGDDKMEDDQKPNLIINSDDLYSWAAADIC